MIIAVADTGPFIHLDEIDALHLLSVVDELLIPQTVSEKLKAGAIPSALSTIEYKLVKAEATELTVELDPGETAALAVASERSAVLLTDDLLQETLLKTSMSKYTAQSALLFSHILVGRSRNRTLSSYCEHSKRRQACSSRRQSWNTESHCSTISLTVSTLFLRLCDGCASKS